jgi:hypothetical protein
MIKYQRNNIVFRISSADAISKFKATQAHSFLQLTRRELDFDDAAKEVVLLEYDRFSHWLFRVERICQSAGEIAMSEALREATIDSFEDELAVIENVLKSHPSVFSPEVIKFTQMVHSYSAKMIAHRFAPREDKHIDETFAVIVGVISNYLQHLLITMHEFNNNIIKKITPPFISVADFCIEDAVGADRFLASLTRAKFFTSHGFGSRFVLKDYSRHHVYDDACEFFSSNDIQLVQEDEQVPPLI